MSGNYKPAELDLIEKNQLTFMHLFFQVVLNSILFFYKNYGILKKTAKGAA